MTKLIILSDYGLDDAAAAVDIFNHSALYSQIDILPIGGNVPVDVAMRNVFVLLSNYPGDVSKVRVIDTSSIPQPNEYLKEIHGQDGMGDLFEMRKKVDVPLLDYNKWIETLSDDDIVLSLGPMTVVKDIFVKSGPKPLVVMAGCIDEEPNFNGYEFNHCLDRGAFSYCVKYPHVSATLDTCRIPEFNIETREIEGDDLLSMIMRRDQVLGIQRKEKGCYVWDDIAVKYLIHPEWFTSAVKTDRDGNKVNSLIYIGSKHYLDMQD